MTSNEPRISVSPARRYRVAAGRRWAGGGPASAWRAFVKLAASARACTTVCRHAISVRCSERPARHGRLNLTGICRRLFVACCSTRRQSAPTSLTVLVLPIVRSQTCACGCELGRKMQGHRARSPASCNSVPPACGKTSCPISGAAGPWQPACPASTMVAGCVTAARRVVRALRRSAKLALCHSSTAPFATLISRNQQTRQARAPGASSG